MHGCKTVVVPRLITLCVEAADGVIRKPALKCEVWMAAGVGDEGVKCIFLMTALPRLRTGM